MRDAIRDAYARSADLAKSGRSPQAADVLKAAMATAATALGAHNPRVLGLRRQRAAGQLQALRPGPANQHPHQLVVHHRNSGYSLQLRRRLLLKLGYDISHSVSRHDPVPPLLYTPLPMVYARGRILEFGNSGAGSGGG